MISSEELLEDRLHVNQAGLAFEPHELSERAYIGVLGLYVVLGTIATGLVAVYAYTSVSVDNVLLYLGLGVVLPIAGVVVAIQSESWQVSTAGFAMVAIPIGAFCGVVLSWFEVGSIVRAMLITGAVVLIMWIVALSHPPIVADFTGAILAGLMILLIGQLSGFVLDWLGLPSLPADPTMWFGIVLFTGLILYDVNKAMQRTRTLDNAVDSAVGIYLDIVNLFLRFLREFGKSKRR